MRTERRYYSINEISILTGLSLNKLRYAERVIPNFNIHKIRNRRYYTSKNLDQLIKFYNKKGDNLLKENLIEKESNKPDEVIKDESITDPYPNKENVTLDHQKPVIEPNQNLSSESITKLPDNSEEIVRTGYFNPEDILNRIENLIKNLSNLSDSIISST